MPYPSSTTYPGISTFPGLDDARAMVMRARSRDRWPLARHGRFLTVVPAGVPLVARPRGVVEQGGSRPRWLPTRRGRFTAVVPAVVVVAPSRPPGFVELAGPRPRFPVHARSGTFLSVVPASLVSPARPRRARPVVVLRRPSRFLAGPPALVVAPPGPLVAGVLRGRTRHVPMPARRGVFADAPLQPAAPSAAPALPQNLRRAARAVLRGRSGEFQPVVQASTPPAVDSPKVLRRTPAAARTLPARRGRFLAVVAPRPAGPGPLPPTFLRRPRARHLPLVRSRLVAVVPEQLAPPPATSGAMRADPPPGPSMTAAPPTAVAMTATARVAPAMTRG